MSKLTLSVRPEVVARARQYAKQQGVSMSAIVEAYLAAVGGPAPRTTQDPPILRSLRGTLKKGNIEQHRRLLAAKYK